MTWVAVGVGAMGLVSSFMGSKNANKQVQGMTQADKDWAAKQVSDQTQANRPNQSSDFGNLTWTKDPTTGQWTQTNQLNPAEASRLGDFRQIAANRMRAAGGIDLSYLNKPLNFNAGNIGPQAAGGNTPTIMQPHRTAAPGANPYNHSAGGGAMMPGMMPTPAGMSSPMGQPPPGGPPPTSGPAVPTDQANPAPVISPGYKPMIAPTTPTPTDGSQTAAPTTGGLTPEQQAMIDQLRNAQTASSAGNGSG
jgi:hypothetical protein